MKIPKEPSSRPASRIIAQRRATEPRRDGSIAPEPTPLLQRIADSPRQTAQRALFQRLGNEAAQDNQRATAVENLAARSSARAGLAPGNRPALPRNYNLLWGKAAQLQQATQQQKARLNPLSARSRPSGSGVQPMQLVVAIANSNDVMTDLLAVRGNAPLGRTKGEVFSSWHNSATQHEFSSAVKLNEALASAIATRRTEPGTNAVPSIALPDPPALFRAANLRFLTSTGGARLETLYFASGANSARIRQQHSSGPLVQEPRPGKVDYFGASGTVGQIRDESKAEQEKDLNQRGFEMVRDIIHQRYQANEAYATGQHHLEIWYDDAGNRVNAHKSEGVTVDNPGYTDQDIKLIYSKVVGRIP